MKRDTGTNEENYKKMWELLQYKIQPGGPWANLTVFQLMMELEHTYLQIKVE